MDSEFIKKNGGYDGKDKAVNFRCPEDLWLFLKKMADNNEISASMVIRLILTDYSKKYGYKV